MGTIAGENDFSYVGSPIGNFDLWNHISDVQVNPSGNQIIFSDQSTNKIRKIDFSSGPPPKQTSISFALKKKSNLFHQKKKKIPSQR